jgi:GT2 family glycosyltransferase
MCTTGSKTVRKTRVLVIVPCFNRPKALELCLQSLQRQSIEELNVVVIDDRSDEPFSTQIRGTVERFPNLVKYIKSDTRLGLPAARNLGLTQRRGHDLVLFLDDDCRVGENMMSNLIRLHEETLNLSIKAFVPRLVLTKDIYLHTRFGLAELGKLSKDVYCNFNYNQYAGTKIPFGHACSCFRTEVFDKLQFDHVGFKGNFLREETDFFLRVNKEGWSVVFCPSLIVFHDNIYPNSGCKIGRLENELATIRNHSIFVARHFPLSAIFSVLFFALVRFTKIIAFTLPFMRCNILRGLELLRP